MICAVSPVVRVLCLALTVYSIVLLARVIVSWVELSGWRPPVHRADPHDLRADVRCHGARAEAAPTDRAAGRAARSLRDRGVRDHLRASEARSADDPGEGGPMRKKDKDAADAQDFTGMPAASASLTPAEIQSKEFNVSRFGGYRMRDVDEFLDQITESMTKLADENQRLRSASGLPVAPSIGAPGPGGHVAPSRRDHRERTGGGRQDRAGRAGPGRGRDDRRRGGRDRYRSGRRRAVPRAGAGLPPAAGHPGPVARRVREGDGEGQSGEACRRVRRRPSAAPCTRGAGADRPRRAASRLPRPTRRSRCRR